MKAHWSLLMVAALAVGWIACSERVTGAIVHQMEETATACGADCVVELRTSADTGTNAGAARRSASGGWTRYNTAKGLPGDSIQWITGDSNGGIWFGAGHPEWAMARLDPESEEWDHLRAVAASGDANGRVWFATQEGGLAVHRRGRHVDVGAGCEVHAGLRAGRLDDEREGDLVRHTTHLAACVVATRMVGWDEFDARMEAARCAKPSAGGIPAHLGSAPSRSSWSGRGRGCRRV